MKIRRLIGLFLFIFSFVLFTVSRAQAVSAPSQTEIAVFVRNNCQHCQDEEAFLEKLKQEQANFSITYYRLEDENDKKVWDLLTTRLGISKVTPITVIGNKYLIGYTSGEITGSQIRELIEEAQKTNTPTDLTNPNLQEAGQQNSTCPEDGSIPCTQEAKPAYFISLPIVGKIDTQKYPLLFLSALLGFFDGFNPCAMWVLVTFLIILLQVGSRRKMIIFAGTFILAEAIMYALILTLWYKTWNFVQLDTIITPFVGGLSIIGGLFFLREWRKKEIECKVTNLKKRAATRQKIQDLAASPFTLLTFFGILGIAFSVNIIEFACSLGIPQAFTKIIDLNQLSFSHTSLLIIVYILFYMLDDFIVFAFALYGADKLHLTTRFSKFSNLIGGLVMIILGLVLLFKSQLLLF